MAAPPPKVVSKLWPHEQLLTAFGLTTVKDRTVLAIYFDKNKRVADKAVYSLKDGKVFYIEGRKTPSYGQDTSFIQQLISSV